jgi:hypothetical protein
MPDETYDELTVRELTVEQVLDALDSMDREPHRMAILFPDVPLELVERSAGTTADVLMKYPVSDVEKLVSKVKEANPFFLRLTDRLLSNRTELQKVLPAGS